MTRKQLEQAYWLNRELKMWKSALKRRQNKSLVASPRYDGVAHSAQGNISDPVYDRAADVDEINRIIAQLEDDIQRAKDDAIKFISTIPDSQTRMIVYQRCVLLKSWQAVALAVGGGNTKDSVRKRYTRFFK